MGNEINRLIRALETQGFQVERRGSGHWLVRDAGGRAVATLAATPSDGRGFRNAIAKLRRAGLIWPPPKR